MTNPHISHSGITEQQLRNEAQDSQSLNTMADKPAAYGAAPVQVGAGAAMDTNGEAVKDLIDDALPKGPKRADASTGGRVIVGEEGDLHDLAAKKQHAATATAQERKDD